MAKAGWSDWDDERLEPWLYRIVPDGWFMAVARKSGQIAATCMGTHDYTWHLPFCAEIGWTATAPANQGEGLGTALVGLVMARLIEIGYPLIHLYTEHWRLAALKIYLKLGLVPFLEPPETLARWREICIQLGWPFTPGEWVREL